ncbi:MAG: fibro-slime domain-containing protein [Eubacterium sp.]|nr:fibro-slime domain-containing protein [Eubacterium sp.]
MKKIISYLLVAVMVISGFGAYLQLGRGKENQIGAAQQQQMKMPIVIYDHLNDTLLFEYLNTDTSFGLSMYVDTPAGEGNANSGKNLVEDELGPNGTPVYKKEVVERVAQIVKDTVEQVRTDTNYNSRTDVSDLYRRITTMVLKNEPQETKIEVNGTPIPEQTLEDIGWSFPKEASSKIENNKNNIYDASDNVIWYQEGDQFHAPNGGVDNTATRDLGTLKPGTYRLFAWQNNNLNVSITTSKGTEDITLAREDDPTQTGAGRDGYVYEFTLDSADDVSVTLQPKNSNASSIMPFLLLEKNGETWKSTDLVNRNGKVNAKKLGWVVEEGSSWYAFPGGGISCEAEETTKAYKEVEVTPGEIYRFRCGMNDGAICKTWLEDENGNKLIESLPTFYNESGTAVDDRTATITIPEGMTKVRVYVQNDTTKTGTRRVGEIYMKQMAEARLGNYEDSKAKYDGGAKLEDITTCMDYAYYFLNSFWSDTNGDITQKTNLYQTLTMDLMANSDKYRFSNGQKINYDLDNKNISQDLSTSGTTGLFPLDSAVLGDRSDLSAPFGVADGELTDEKHNYHYAMKAHCQFIYDSSSDLIFNFSGDDDVYLFINGKKAMDIGGAHGAVNGSAELNYIAKSDDASEIERQNKSRQLAQSLGLEDGQIYDFDFFYLERHTSLSNITIETNMPLVQAGVTPKVIFKDKDGNELADGTKVQAGEKVNVEYDVTSTTKINPNAPNKLTGLEITDNELGVQIGYFGNNYPTLNLGNAEVDEAITVTVKGADGQPKQTFSIAKADLYNDDKVREFVSALKNVQLDNKESVTVSGISRIMPADELLKTELDVNVVAPEPYFDDGGHIQFKNSEVVTVPVDAMLIPVNNPDIKVSGVLKDKDGNVLNKDAEGKYKDEYLPQGTEIYPVFTITTDSGQMRDIKLDDSQGTGFVLDKNGVSDPNGFLGENDILVVTYKPAGGDAVTLNVPKTDIDNKNESFLMLREMLNGGISLNKGDELIISGLHKALATDPIKTVPSATATGQIPSYNEETGELSVENKTVTATDTEKKAIPTVEVKFQNGDHGTVTGSKEQTVVCKNKVSNVPTKDTADEGYSFVGWKIAGDNSGKIYTSQEVATLEITKDTTFVAQWELGKVTVEFKAGNNGSVTGTATDKTQTIDYGTKVSNVPGVSEDTGYDFVGWKRKSDGKIYTEDEIKNIVFKADEVFEAVFEAKTMKYTVRYIDENEQDLIEPKKDQKAKYGTEVTEMAEKFPAYDVDKDSQKFTMTVDGTVITFQYTLKQLNVKYEAGDNGELDGDDSETVSYGNKPDNVPTPRAAEGYKFAGWTKKVTGGDSSVEDPRNEEITEDTVFEAVFVPINSNYKVKYVDENGKEIFATKQGEQTQVGKNVTEQYVPVAGYELVSEKTVTKKISEDESENVIVFTYRKVEETTVVKEEPTTKKQKSKKDKKNSKKQTETTQEATTAAGTEKTGVSNTSLISPKTGYGKQFTVIFMMLLASVVMFGISWKKMREE